LCDPFEVRRRVRLVLNVPLTCALALLFVACNETAEPSEPTAAASAITAAAPAQLRLEKRENHRARIDSLKQQAQSASEGPDKQALLRQIDDEVKGYVSTQEGHLEPLAVQAPDPATAITAAQRASLLAKMAAFDMSKPADVARWAQLKHKELGR